MKIEAYNWAGRIGVISTLEPDQKAKRDRRRVLYAVITGYVEAERAPVFSTLRFGVPLAEARQALADYWGLPGPEDLEPLR